jgi:hypothetical protein
MNELQRLRQEVAQLRRIVDAMQLQSQLQPPRFQFAEGVIKSSLTVEPSTNVNTFVGGTVPLIRSAPTNRSATDQKATTSELDVVCHAPGSYTPGSYAQALLWPDGVWRMLNCSCESVIADFNSGAFVP